MTREETDITPEEAGAPERWLIREIRRPGSRLWLTVLLSCLIGGLSVFQAVLLGQACQLLVIEGEVLGRVLPLAAGCAVAALARGGGAFLLDLTVTKESAQLRERIRSLLYRRLQQPASRRFEPAGALAETVTAAVEGIDPYLCRFVPQLIQAAVIPPVVLLAVFPGDWRPAMVLLLSAPFIPLFMVLIGRASDRLHRRQWGHLSRMAGQLLDLMRGLPDLRIFGVTREKIALAGRISEEYRHSTMSILRVAFLSAFTLEFFATVGTAVVAVVTGFRLLEGSLELSAGLAILLLAPEFYLPLRSLGLAYHARMQGVAAAGRILPLLATGDSAPPDSAVVRETPARSPAGPNPPEIVFEGVTYRPAGGRGGVADIHLRLPPGSSTALIGESGSGKTTIARLLAGLIRPQSGRIMIDGRDLAAMDMRGWQDQVAWVPQQPFFFRGTVAANLLLGREDAGEEEIRCALEDAAAAGFVNRLPLGIHTQLGDRGAGLSGGELRRLAVARALLRRASVVVLDEPTAGLDPENERLVGEALQRLASGRTVLLISHRKETIGRMQRAVRLKGGSIDPLSGNATTGAAA